MVRSLRYKLIRCLAAAILILVCPCRAGAQGTGQEKVVNREVTLYNPYQPSLNEVRKMSFLPDMTDTVRVRPDFNYVVSARPFQPEYTISQIKAAALLPDPLPKLYKSYIKLGYGNHVSPMAEISITNERSKKGAFGIYGRHFSTNDYIMLPNTVKSYAGYMDNDASLFGRKFFRKSTLEGSVDVTQKVRHAYGYDPLIIDYIPSRSATRMTYNNIGGKVAFSSTNLDSTDFYYDFELSYNYFHQSKFFYQHTTGFDGLMAKSLNGMYVGSGLSFAYYNPSDSTGRSPDFIISANPFIKKRTGQWNFKLGMEILLDRSSILHVYPDLELGFSIVQSYLGFFASLSGKMERNEPLKIITENPYLVRDQFPDFVHQGVLYRLPDTDHKLIVTSGVKGNTGTGGNYIVSASYSVIDNYLFYSNLEFPDSLSPRAVGNYFLPVPETVDLLNLHAEMTSPVNDKLSFRWIANYYKYTTSQLHPWNRPDWDGQIGLNYNLRDKIIAGLELTAMGKRWQIVNGDVLSAQAGYNTVQIQMPVHFNLNLNAEYRYSRILSFWIRFNNIALDRYYEWAFYPSQTFIGMVGLTYSL